MEDLPRSNRTRFGIQANSCQKRISRSHYQQRNGKIHQASEQPIEQQQPIEKQRRYKVLPNSNHKVDAFVERSTKLVSEKFI
jgi:hypothetical protein